jgi:ATP-binding cassette, subfamily B, bacterial MsbA
MAEMGGILHPVLSARDANAHGFIMQLPQGYDTELGTSGGHLSGGQCQRLSIASAFLKDAPVLILGEPTSALDTLSEAQFVKALGRLRHHRTTFVIAHRLSTVREADRIIVMDAGKLAAVGTHTELLCACPLYARPHRWLRRRGASARCGSGVTAL